MLTPEQLVAANHAGLDALVALTRKSFEGIERLVELNLRMMRGTLGDSLSVPGADHMPRVAQQANAYSRELCEIAISTQKEVHRLVNAQLAAAQQTILVMVDTAVKSTPEAGAGRTSSELVCSTVSAASQALEDLQRAARDAVHRTGAQVDALVHPAGRAEPADAHQD
ncbi:MAG: hypothetical protein RLZZ592_1294 [Pseudomonadota bacterium]